MADDLALATPPEPKTAPAPSAGAPAGGQSFPQSLLSAIGAGSSRAQARIDRADAEEMELGERAKRLQADLEHITSQVQKPPPLYQSDPMQGFGSVAMSLAALGSLLTRRPLTTALSAGAEVMKAHAANDAAAAKQAFDTWKTSTDEAIKLHQFEQDAYQAGIQKLKADREGARVDLLVTAAALKDDVVKHLLETGRTDEAVSVIAGRGRLGSSLGGAASAATDRQLMTQAMNEWKAQFAADNGRQPTAQEMLGQRGQLQKELKGDLTPEERKAKTAQAVSDEAADLIADRFLAGDRQAIVGFGRNVASQTKIQNAVTRRAQELGMTGPEIAAKSAEFQGTLQGERTLGAITANVERAVNEAQQLAPLALTASEAVDRTQYPTLNSLLIAAQRGTGDENVTRLSVAVNSLINVYARGINPQGVPTDSDKNHARDILDAAYSKGQFRTAIDQMMLELDAARKSPGVVRQEFHDVIAGGSKIGGAAAAPKPMPASKADLVTGATYNTARGAAKWNGTAFEAVK